MKKKSVPAKDVERLTKGVWASEFSDERIAKLTALAERQTELWQSLTTTMLPTVTVIEQFSASINGLYSAIVDTIVRMYPDSCFEQSEDGLCLLPKDHATPCEFSSSPLRDLFVEHTSALSKEEE